MDPQTPDPGVNPVPTPDEPQTPQEPVQQPPVDPAAPAPEAPAAPEAPVAPEQPVPGGEDLGVPAQSNEAPTDVPPAGNSL